ncbi:MAG: hypothetical protein KDN20_19455, partial [Verrucomicrobiae bacterium]|nr:hypothetical protein [Verrucomicrobiae bacterium]
EARFCDDGMFFLHSTTIVKPSPRLHNRANQSFSPRSGSVQPSFSFNPLTYFEINPLRFHPSPLNEGAKEFFSLIENSSDQKANSLNVGKGVSGMLSDPEFQVLIRFAAQKRDVIIHQSTSAMVSKDQFFTATIDHGVLLAGTASPMGEGAIALSLFIPSSIGGPLPENPNTRLFVADRSTLAYTVEAPKGEKTRLYFIQTYLIDPAS